MATSNQTTDPSISNFTTIFDAASHEYKTLTKQDLGAHPFAAALEGHNSPDSILNVFQNQAQTFDEFRKGDDKLMASLTPIVNILFTFSASLGEGIGLPFSPAKTIFTGIGVLLKAVRDITASYEALINLFERIQFFLQRLNHYTAVQLTPEMTLLLGKIMAQVLSILALSTKEMNQRRIKTFMMRLMGKTVVEDALQRLDMLTKEEDLMTAARTLEVAHHVDDKVTTLKEVVRDVEGNVKATKELTHDVREDVIAIKEGTRSVNDNVNVTKHAMDELQRSQLRKNLRTWLSPPDPSINHNTACSIQHDGTATWFIRGGRFEDWKNNSSLLWIRGNPGSGKSVLCSAIIEDIKHMRESRSALVTYYYFNFNDQTKRDIGGFLASILLQLVNASDSCQDTLYQLYKICGDGSEQPSEAALARCLNGMIDLPGQVPIYVIVDALDECPNDTGTPSAREKVLNLMRDLIRSNQPNLFVCITSRPEQDINTTLNSLTSPSHRVSLHEEGGQRKDIDLYIRSFVQNDAVMRRWRAEDKELVINILSERADGMFRWVYCQLDTLRRCMPSCIQKVLNELPVTLDGTYERILQCIPREKSQHARRLFQCMVAACRPLRVAELAEIFAIEFGADDTPNLVAGWRPDDPEEAVLSTCSTLIAIVIDDLGSNLVQFSHFSVKEFLTSDRLQTLDVGSICQYYIPLGRAHEILARACVTALVQLDNQSGQGRIRAHPLAPYAIQNWMVHARFEDVALRIQDSLIYLFNPEKPHFRPWFTRSATLRAERQVCDPEKVTPLYCAAYWDLSKLAKHLIVTHAEDVNAKCGEDLSPLHSASRYGHIDSARILLDHRANVDQLELDHWTPLHYPSIHGHLKVIRLLLEHKANVEAQSNARNTPLSLASQMGRLDTVRLLLDHGADANARTDKGLTLFQLATHYGNHDIAQLLLKRGAERE